MRILKKLATKTQRHKAAWAMALCVSVALWFIFAHAPRSLSASLQSKPRVAVIGFVDGAPASKELDAARQSANALTVAMSQDARVAVIDASQLRAALAGAGYNGSINMSRDEARNLGAAIGCDFFVIGKLDLATRSEAKEEAHEEAIIGVMIVDGRTGLLAAFDFLSARAATRPAALVQLLKAIGAQAASYVERMNQYRTARAAAQNTPPPERIEALPDADSAAAEGFNAPEMLNRVKPEYSASAERADINATVEAMVVFGKSGEVGEIEITRWAGFDLEASAERAIRQLKFKPATRDGQPISVRAVVRYNFHRVNEPASPPAAPVEKPEEKPVPDLRQYFKPRYRPPGKN